MGIEPTTCRDYSHWFQDTETKNNIYYAYFFLYLNDDDTIEINGLAGYL